MRADMGKVLVERPRIKSRRSARGPAKGYRKRLDRCYADDGSPPLREGIKHRYGNNRKHFNEHLGPLRRFLDSNVGRPWDKVYSEICRHVDRENVVQKHILTHLFDYVVVRTVSIDGEPCRAESHWGHRYGEPLRTSTRRHRWYVCPKSGLLRKSRYVPRRKERPEPPRTLALNKRQVCVFREGRWELISVALVSRSVPFEAPAYGAILRGYIDGEYRLETDAVRFRDGNRYAVARRVLSRRDLLALPLPIEWLT
jgi:hypothetical protein